MIRTMNPSAHQCETRKRLSDLLSGFSLAVFPEGGRIYEDLLQPGGKQHEWVHFQGFSMFSILI